MNSYVAQYAYGPTQQTENFRKDIGGFKKFQRVLKFFEGLHSHACERDLAGNRKLHYDQYIGLILLYYFNPILTSLRGIQHIFRGPDTLKILF